jgi:ferric-dicitrate binding protein FerR (iron transport regulator)
VDVSGVAAWRQGRLVFDNIPLSEAFEILARRYDVPVKIEGDISGRKIFSAHENEPLEEVLKVLELTYDLDIEQTNDTIFVRNK